MDEDKIRVWIHIRTNGYSGGLFSSVEEEAQMDAEASWNNLAMLIEASVRRSYGKDVVVTVCKESVFAATYKTDQHVAAHVQGYPREWTADAESHVEEIGYHYWWDVDDWKVTR